MAFSVTSFPIEIEVDLGTCTICNQPFDLRKHRWTNGLVMGWDVHCDCGIFDAEIVLQPPIAHDQTNRAILVKGEVTSVFQTLDREIAKEVMGLDLQTGTVPEYSTDPALAWTIVGKLIVTEGPFVLLPPSVEGYCASFRDFTALEKTIPLAICKATLAAVRNR